MSDEFGFEGKDFEADGRLLEELLDRLELQETGAAPPSPRPIFDFQFPAPAGCPPLTEQDFNRIVRQAVVEAIRLANNGASKLEAAVAVPREMRDDKAQETARLYSFFFCHDPSTPVPWAGNEPSGLTVAKRFRAIARELGGGRRIRFRCDPNCNPTTRAHTNQTDEPNVINLCPLFFNPPAQPGLPPEGFRGGVVLHEMLHVLFTSFFHHGIERGERRRNNAHCFRNFALRALGYGQDNFAIRSCTDLPC